MTENRESMKAFLDKILGAWSGAEKMSGGPQGPDTIEAQGRFENQLALGGNGLTSAYQQEIGGNASIYCQTTYRFDDDGSVLMTWTPSTGDAQLFKGALEGNVIRVSHTGEDGMTQTIETDYGDGEVARLRSSISGNGMPEMIVFSAEYRKQ